MIQEDHPKRRKESELIEHGCQTVLALLDGIPMDDYFWSTDISLLFLLYV